MKGVSVNSGVSWLITAVHKGDEKEREGGGGLLHTSVSYLTSIQQENLTVCRVVVDSF